MNGRPAHKYRYAPPAITSASADDVKSEAFVYIDKETGLPLRAELYSEFSGKAQGARRAKIVAEMRDISRIVDDSLFEIPTSLNKIPPEQIRAQVNAFTRTLAPALKALLSNMSASAPTNVQPQSPKRAQ